MLQMLFLKLIKPFMMRFFNQNEMRMLLDTHFYSVLFYNASIWLTPILKCDMKQKLLSISAHVLRTCLSHDGFDVSFENVHKIHNKCTPKQVMFFQMALKLHKQPNEHENILSYLLDCKTTPGNKQVIFYFRLHRSFKGANVASNTL